MKAKEVKSVKSPKTYVVDKTKLTEQLLKDDVSNWLIETGANMVLEGKTPGKNMIYFLEYMKIIKSV